MIVRFWSVIFALIILLWFFREYNQYVTVGVDVGVFLKCARELLDGKKMYVDIFELNPPLISYISTIPAVLSNVCSIGLAKAYVIFTISVAALSLLLCSLALQQAANGVDQAAQPKEPVAAMLCALLLGLCFDPASYPHFGQREQLFVLLYVPFFIVRWIRMSGREVGPVLASCVGLLAGVGCSIKPYFFVLAFSVELSMLLLSKRWSLLKMPEIAAFFFSIFVYIGHFFFWGPPAATNFWCKTVPMVVKYYAVLNIPITQALLLKHCSESMFELMICVALGGILLRRQSALIPPLLAWIAASYASYVIQCKGWSYQAVPLAAGIEMLIGVLIVVSVNLVLRSKIMQKYLAGESGSTTGSTTKKALRPVLLNIYPTLQILAMSTLVALCTLAALAIYPGKGCPPTPEFAKSEQWLSQNTHPGDVVMLCAVDWRWFDAALLDHHFKSGWRYAWGYPALLLQAENKAANSSIEKEQAQTDRAEFIRQTYEDIAVRKPRVILLDRFMKRWLIEYGLFAQAFQPYKLVGTIRPNSQVWKTSEVYERGGP